jgi:HEAT repeat protein
MVASQPIFRSDATAEELVSEFAVAEHRMPAFLSLYTRGDEALPAIREGMKAANWQVRKWCALFTDNFADAETLHALVPLLRDPKAAVRTWAVHSLSCEGCKDGPNPIDAVPLLLERIEMDESIKVRRQAVAMLAGHRSPDARVLPVFKKILSEEEDRKLRLHAETGVKRYAELGLRS